ncbi:MAG: hypothetical protein FJZ01_23075 [Candidatus Sericytochromatia bacterium]|nr:hypothetical protein [Candidatus Tanganyikabacteria bacterium]
MRRNSPKSLAIVALAGALVAGCNLSPGQIKDLAAKALSAAQSDTGKAIANQVVSNLQAYTDIDAGQALADAQAGLSALDGFSVQAATRPVIKPPVDLAKELRDKVGAELKQGIKEQPRQAPPPSFDQAKNKMGDLMKGRVADLTKMAQADKDKFRDNMLNVAKPKIDQVRKDVAKRVDSRVKKLTLDKTKYQQEQSTASLDPFGEVTIVSATMSVTANGVARQHVFDRYYDDAKVLVRVVDHVEATFPKSGAKHVTDRDRINFDDGTYKVTFSAKTSGKNSKTRTVEWTREGKADGSETGTGTITRFDGTKTEVTYTKDTSGKTVTATTDAASKAKVEVTQTEGAAEATVVIADAENPEKKTSETVDTEAEEPKAE